MSHPKTLLMLLAFLAAGAAHAERKPIDRQALVTRHSPTITAIDKSAPFMVGNGNFAFTADITGLQTFPEQYSSLAPLLIESQWSWHSFPNPQNYTLQGALKPIKVPHRKTVKYPALSNWDEARAANIQWLRENPHRFSLGRLALHLEGEDGKRAVFADLSATKQTLDLWNGRIESSFTWLGQPVEVETSVYPYRDMLIVRVKSPLLSDGRVGVDLKFAGVSHNLNPDPSDWAHPEAHHTEQIAECPGGFVVRRDIDGTQYFVRVQADKTLRVKKNGQHDYQMSAPGVNEVTLLVIFQPDMITERPPPVDKARLEVPSWWQNYWTSGGFVDLTGSRHPKADELQRRIILSQYLTAVNSAGTMPPQEEGLFSNSWNGKFHLEMHPWHAAHFAIWGHPDLLERSMPWYLAHLEEARARAKANGVKGAWWPKMVGPEGRESPSTVNPFIMWQQPHPIYLAETLWLARGKDRATLERYRELVFQTADMLATWPFFDRKALRYILGPPLMPAQENFDPLTTYNPTFELEYFRFGIATAQMWRTRLGLPKDPKWDDVLFRLSRLPEKDGLYLAAESQPDLWERARSPQCSRGNTASECPNRDHPSFVAALGLLPGWGADRETMRRTLKAIVSDWDLRQTWGWDWPMLAMTATRLDEPEMAIDFLLTDAKNFQFGVSGMTPRVHIVTDAAPHAAGSDDGPGYRRAAETYFPSNGSLLLAIGLMVAGGQSVHELNPGFPPNGQWIVHSEGITPLP
ncbi:MAG TPA: hypothetical protein VFL16_14840 [Steroidobacteraceae bacterium]|nr:hypothetical protein [Steroidobacteraceae bacterium]